MTRRIAVVGSFSTGKTTLAVELADRLGLPILPEVAREVVEMGFKLDKDATPETEALIFIKQYNNELFTPDFVGDRSLIDVMAYAGWVLDNQPPRKEMILWRECERLAEHGLKDNYSHIYYLPIEFPIVLDGLRPDDPAFQKDIDERILGLLESHGLPYVTVRGTVKERIEFIEADLDRVNVPNWITVGRVALIPVFLYLAYEGTDAYAVSALIVFLLASASDILDGYLARRNDHVSRLGQFLDPLADKLLVGAALIVLVDLRAMPLWAALLIAFREIAVQILRTQIVSGGGSLPASYAAKAKTALQILLVAWWLLPMDVGPVHWVLLAAALVSTYWSGAEYFLKARHPEEVVP